MLSVATRCLQMPTHDLLLITRTFITTPTPTPILASFASLPSPALTPIPSLTSTTIRNPAHTLTPTPTYTRAPTPTPAPNLIPNLFSLSLLP